MGDTEDWEARGAGEEGGWAKVGMIAWGIWVKKRVEEEEEEEMLAVRAHRP